MVFKIMSTVPTIIQNILRHTRDHANILDSTSYYLDARELQLQVMHSLGSNAQLEAKPSGRDIWNMDPEMQVFTKEML